MPAAHYSVIRYMPDPGRGERLNIGVVLWTSSSVRFQLDQAALDRVVRDNPRLERESLYYVESSIRERLGAERDLEGRVQSLLTLQGGFPVDITETRFTTVASEAPDALEQAVEGLTARIVRPRRAGRASIDARARLERKLKPLVRSGRVEQNRIFLSSTGVQRRVDFYANSQVNTALDVLKLSLRRADDIRSRADAEAFKALDIQRQNDLRYFVFCELSADRSLADVYQTAARVIESTGATVVTDQDAAERAIRYGLAAT